MSKELTEDLKKSILQKISKEPSPGNIVRLLEVERDALVEKAISEMGDTLTEAEKNLWFPNEETRFNLERVTSDLRDVEHWKTVAQQYKNNEISEDTFVDYLTLSHLSVTEEPDPMAVLDRQVRDGLKSRTGVKIVKQLVGKMNTVFSDTVKTFVQALPEETRHQMTVKLLAPIASTESENAGSLVPVNEDLHSYLNTNLTLFTEVEEERILREMFAGEVIYDRLVELSYEDLVLKLKDVDDLDFSTVRTIVVDAGMEYPNKVVNRDVQIDQKKSFVIYIAWLKNIFEGFKGTSSEDRGIDKFRLNEDITQEQFNNLMALIKHRYVTYINGRLERGSLDQGWLTQEEVSASLKLPEYDLDPTLAMGIVTQLVEFYRKSQEAFKSGDLSDKAITSILGKATREMLDATDFFNLKKNAESVAK